MRIIMMGLFAGSAALACAAPAPAQDRTRTSEIYHIFDFQTAATKSAVIAAAEAGLKRNVHESDTSTPIVMGAPPEQAARFKIVDALDGHALGGLAAMMGASQQLQFKQARCDGAIWIANAMRKVRGSQMLRLTLCLFPYRGGYQLDVYGIDSKDRGGGVSQLLGRAMAETVLGKPGDWTNKTVPDVVRAIRSATQAKVAYVEGQPEFTGTPWDETSSTLPQDGEKDRGAR